MSNFNLDLNKKYTYEDYLNWSFDETVELIMFTKALDCFGKNSVKLSAKNSINKQ